MRGVDRRRNGLFSYVRPDSLPLFWQRSRVVPKGSHHGANDKSPFKKRRRPTRRPGLFHLQPRHTLATCATSIHGDHALGLLNGTAPWLPPAELLVPEGSI